MRKSKTGQRTWLYGETESWLYDGDTVTCVETSVCTHIWSGLDGGPWDWLRPRRTNSMCVPVRCGAAVRSENGHQGTYAGGAHAIGVRVALPVRAVLVYRVERVQQAHDVDFAQPVGCSFSIT